MVLVSQYRLHVLGADAGFVGKNRGRSGRVPERYYRLTDQ